MIPLIITGIWLIQFKCCLLSYKHSANKNKHKHKVELGLVLAFIFIQSFKIQLPIARIPKVIGPMLNDKLNYR